MKKHLLFSFIISSVLCFAGEGAPVRIGTVSFKECLERTKYGKQEQARFEQLKSDLEKEISEKEKVLKEISPKFSEEYLDSLTPEAEAELKEKFGRLSQELTHMQNQYYQTLNQANMQVVQKLFEMIGEASKRVAKEKGLVLILNDETCFYKDESLDVTAAVIEDLDKSA